MGWASQSESKRTKSSSIVESARRWYGTWDLKEDGYEQSEALQVWGGAQQSGFLLLHIPSADLVLIWGTCSPRQRRLSAWAFVSRLVENLPACAAGPLKPDSLPSALPLPSMAWLEGAGGREEGRGSVL